MAPTSTPTRTDQPAAAAPAPAPQAAIVTLPKVDSDAIARVTKADDPAKLVEFCRTRPDQAAAMLHALLTRDTAELPGTVFVQRDGAILKKVRSDVRLTQAEKHLNPIRSEQINGQWVVTDWDINADGYRKLNQYVGLMVLGPAHVAVDDRLQPNPFVERDANGIPTIVHCRKLAIGPNPATGALVATDITIRYSLALYFLEALQAQMKEKRDVIWVGEADENPVTQGRQRWKFLPIASGIGLWVDLRSPELLDAIKKHTQRLKFAERMAQTICERNAMRAHPAMPSSVKAENGVAMVRVTSWATATSRSDLDNFMRALEKNELKDVMTVSARVIDVDETARDAAVADGVVEEETAAESPQDDAAATPTPEAGQDAGTSAGATPEPTVDELRAAAVKKVARLNEIFGPKPTRERLERELKIPKGALNGATPDQLTRVLELSEERAEE